MSGAGYFYCLVWVGLNGMAVIFGSVCGQHPGFHVGLSAAPRRPRGTVDRQGDCARQNQGLEGLTRAGRLRV
jgi:hypothetical protein